MNGTRIVILAFGLLVIIGGLIGYIKTGSVISLTAGIAFGAAIIASGIVIFYKEHLGYKLALATTALLLLTFGYRFAVTHKFMPSGLMAILCLVVLWMIRNELKLLKNKS